MGKNTKFARCACCKHYYLVSMMDVLECDSCTYRTYRCRSAKCAGAAGTARSVNAHASYWRGRGRGVGGHG